MLRTDFGAVSYTHLDVYKRQDKYRYIKLCTPGTDSRTADGYLYQNRNFGDLCLLEKKVEGCAMNVAAGA